MTRHRLLVAVVTPLLVACAAAAPAESSTGVAAEPHAAAAKTGSTSTAARAVPNIDRVAVSWRRVASGLVAPTQVTSARDGVRRLFVVQKGGVVRIFRNGHVLDRPYLDLSALVSTDSERGLLSVAFPPDFRKHPFVFANYTRKDGDVVLARFRAASPKAAHVRASTRRVLLRVEHSTYGNHDGGQLVFGPDGMLYMGIGDGGSANDPFRSAQDRSALLGKILRIDVSCRKLYCIPPGNPFAGATPGRGEIWLLGLRNPWRMSFDPATGRLWIGDVGQDAYEEVDRVAADPTHRNLGWSCREGFHVLFPDRCRKNAHYVAPVTEVPHPRGESVTGGYVYRGTRFASLLAGVYVFGDYVTRKVWLYAAGQGKVLQADRLGPATYAGPTSFGTDDAGEIWAVTYDGTLWRMRAKSR